MPGQDSQEPLEVSGLQGLMTDDAQWLTPRQNRSHWLPSPNTVRAYGEFRTETTNYARKGEAPCACSRACCDHRGSTFPLSQPSQGPPAIAVSSPADVGPLSDPRCPVSPVRGAGLGGVSGTDRATQPRLDAVASIGKAARPT